MHLMHEHIKECFGREWLKQQKINLTDEVMDFGRANVHTAYKIVNNTLITIDEILGRLRHIERFDVWLKEAATASDEALPDILFELYCFDNLKFTQDTMVLKPYNSTGRELEALLKTEHKELYVEMQSITEMKRTPKKKVNKFFGKARKKFTDKDGILFVDISRINNVPQPMLPYITLSSQVAAIKDEIIRRFNDPNHANARTEAIVLVNLSWATNPLRSWDVFFDKRFLLLPKPENRGGYGHNNSFWNDVFNVKEFHIGDKVLE